MLITRYDTAVIDAQTRYSARIAISLHSMLPLMLIVLSIGLIPNDDGDSSIYTLPSY